MEQRPKELGKRSEYGAWKKTPKSRPLMEKHQRRLKRKEKKNPDWSKGGTLKEKEVGQLQQASEGRGSRWKIRHAPGSRLQQEAWEGEWQKGRCQGGMKNTRKRCQRGGR